MNELERQQALLHSLWSRDGGAALGSAVQEQGARRLRGWQAYQANGGMSAERSLAARYPTVQALLGEESFAALARAFWHAQPPQRGDLAQFGDGLPDFIAESEQLADVPYVADCARLDALVAGCEQAGEAECDMASLGWLAEVDPAELTLALVPGVALLSSRYPVATLWLAHRPGEDSGRRLAEARDALATGQGEHALVWREGWRARVQAVDAAEARWTQAVLAQCSLAEALERAGEAFEVQPWLVDALQQRRLAGVRRR